VINTKNRPEWRLDKRMGVAKIFNWLQIVLDPGCKLFQAGSWLIQHRFFRAFPTIFSGGNAAPNLKGCAHNPSNGEHLR
jgi:hypothetical protein